MNPFDAYIIHFLNQFAHRSWTFDSVMILVSGSSLLKGGMLMAVFWWVWFGKEENRARNREILLFGLFGSVFALVLARVLALAVPFRERPLREPTLGFHLPYGMNENALAHWNSFPSDHAVLFFAIAATIFFVAPRAGWLSFAQTFFIICLPRIYLGIHYPTDILAGALLGIGIASLSRIAMLRSALAGPAVRWIQESPGICYSVLFLLTSQIAMIFDPVREIVTFIALMPTYLLIIILGILLFLGVLLRVSRMGLLMPHSREAEYLEPEISHRPPPQSYSTQR